MLADYHIHTELCQHAEGKVSAFRARAVDLGLPEICFTDHVPNPDGYDPVNRMRLDQFSLYRTMVADLARTSQPVVLFGVEADYYDGCERFLQDWLPRQEFDLVLGSVHYINNWGFDNPDERHVWDSVDVTNTWRTYFDLIGKLADIRLTDRQLPDSRLADRRLADVVGHLDLPKKFGHRPSDLDLREMAQPALDRVAAAGMAIEINSSGLRRQVHEIYPSALLLSLAKERDIPICFGSDAHRPEEVGWQFDASLALARSVGYTHAVQYRRRQPLSYALPTGV
ncbi:MAG: histidinol-phosphatase HisJ family protein [Verrucomicrobia bacterium]|nr:histidinol-phosphatase HisJ family protein [Verrucomicrobiota bacterium]MBU1734059.1 histidinol-phosphatase HisJ family protein [Verrucomicrobiota bacterium]MBU1855731.1 histidinol-phosphatase HisJ family protein [Verrucomicrobiota bacterium]